MSDKYLRIISNNINERIDKLDGEGLELYLADLLRAFESQGWKVHLTRRSGDFGADLVLDNPDRVRYVIQTKKREDGEKCEGLGAVQQAVAAKAVYNAQHAVAVSSREVFSDQAKELAEANGALLWSREQLQLLYEASLSRDEQLLNSGLGLELARPPVPPEPAELVVALEAEPKPQPRALWPRVLAGLAAGGALGLVLAFTLPKPMAQVAQVQQGQALSEIRQLVEGHDRAWVEAQAANNPELLRPYRDGEALEGTTKSILARQALGCTITVEPQQQPRISDFRLEGDTARVEVEKSWNQRLECDQPISAEQEKAQGVLSGKFTAWYGLTHLPTGWRITTAGIAKGFGQ